MSAATPPALPPATLTRHAPGAWALLYRLYARWRCARASPPAWPDESHLAEAADLIDLERRLRRLERGRADRFGPLPR